ncbi:hypothetical protein AeNC1_009151 [Aphanomyces euteiches]|nr:hypothetical protein Ae201684P_018588 [Aphanomyces euteiches]KAH9144032.1 hypothetical protein AeRB84_011995 [Aphanomyces euteiches]KAH9188871.1 hypothetical protein AeNC1_009151 [Aphanomyces euteiches]
MEASSVDNLLGEESPLVTILNVTFYVILGIAGFIVVVGLCFCWLNKRADVQFEGTFVSSTDAFLPTHAAENNVYRELEEATPKPVSARNLEKRSLAPIKKTPSRPLPPRVKPTSPRPPEQVASPSTVQL